jgi:hypothetical protein
MKKNFLTKKLASGLALALVVASLSPAGVSAATATKIVKQDKSKAPTVLYVGDKGTDYTLSSTSKANTYSWKISNSKVATINAKSGVVTAKAPGTVTIKVTARNAKTNKWLKDFTLKLSIKQRAKTVDIGSDNFELAVGTKKDLNAVKTPKTSTDVVVYGTSDAKIATVNAKTGVVTAVAPGTATITVYSKGLSSSAITSKYNRTDSVKVTVLDGITGVKQTTTTKVEVSLATDQSKDLTKDNLVITDANGIKQIIKEVKFSADGKVATAELFISFVDKAVYKVAYADTAKDFTASIGEVAKIELTGKTVKYGEASNLGIKLFDANGIDVTTTDAVRNNVTFDYDAAKAYVTYDSAANSHQITVFNFPEAVTVKAIYHTYQYEGVTEKVFESSAVINSVEKLPSLATGIKYTVAKTSANWDKLNTTIPANGEGYKVFIKAKDNNDKDITEKDFSFESTDVNVLSVSKDGDDVYVYGGKAGSAYLKATFGDTTQMLLITVGSEAKATAVTIDKTSVSLTSTLVGEKQVVTLSAKDQYGNDMPVGNATVSPVSSSPEVGAEAVGNKITFTPDGISKTGNYVFRVTYYDRTFTVTANAVYITDATVKTIRVEASTTATTIDAALKSSTSEDQKVVYTVYGYNAAGQKVAIMDQTDDALDFTVKFKNATMNDTDQAKVLAVDTSKGEATFTALKLHAKPSTVSKAAVGTYVITAEAKNVDGTVVYNTRTITVTDSQEAVTASRNSASVNAGTVGTAIADGIKFSTTVKVVGVDANINGSKTTDLSAPISKDNSVFVNKVIVERTIGDYVVQQEITVGLGFPVK